MKFDLLINGSLQLRVTPETPIEQLVLSEMLARSGKGQGITLDRSPSDEWPAVFSVEK